jgi:hypothetical protein
MASAGEDVMNSTDKAAGSEPGTSEEFAETPPSGAGPRPAPANQRPGRLNPDKEGGAPVDELDLDGDGSHRQ